MIKRTIYVCVGSLLLLVLPVHGHDLEVDGIYYNIISDGAVEVTYYGDNSYSAMYSGEISIPNSIEAGDREYQVTSVGRSAFALCNTLVKVVLPESVRIIASSAFWEAGGLSTVSFPEGLERIEDAAFYGAVNLHFSAFPSTLKYIGASAFYGVAKNLTSVMIPASVDTVRTSAFAMCEELRSIRIANASTRFFSGCFSDTAWERESADGFLVIDGVLFGFKGDIPSVLDIPEGVVQIVQNCFQNVNTFNEVTFPNTIQCIYDDAFSSTGISEIKLPSRLLKLGQRAFYNCPNLLRVDFNDCPLDSIEPYSFSNCTALGQVNFSGQTKRICDNAFMSDEALVEVSLPELLEYVGRQSFSGCSLNSIVFGGQEKTIGEAAFSSNKLVRVVLPESLEMLDCLSFSNNQELTRFDIPPSVTTVGYWTLFACYKLDSLVVHWQDPSVCKFKKWDSAATDAYDIVFNVFYDYITLFVPTGTVSLYRDSPLWGQFSTIKETEVATGLPATERTANMADEGCYDLQGRKHPSRIKGLHISRGRKFYER